MPAGIRSSQYSPPQKKKKRDGEMGNKRKRGGNQIERRRKVGEGARERGRWEVKRAG